MELHDVAYIAAGLTGPATFVFFLCCCSFFFSMNDFHSTCNTHKAFWLYCLKNHSHYNNNAVNSFCVCVCVSFPLTRRNEWRRQPIQSIDNLETKIKKEKGVIENLKRRFIFFFSDVFHRCRRLLSNGREWKLVSKSHSSIFYEQQFFLCWYAAAVLHIILWVQQ